jgi:RNA polymerase sigma-70 factor (ECF subfamily)
MPLREEGEPGESVAPSRQVTEALVTRQVLTKMPPRLRVVLLLREQGQLSYQEIAVALGLPVGTVRSRLSKARATFRKMWSELLCSEEAEV